MGSKYLRKDVVAAIKDEAHNLIEVGNYTGIQVGLALQRIADNIEKPGFAEEDQS